jgi:hypothetical protein
MLLFLASMAVSFRAKNSRTVVSYAPCLITAIHRPCIYQTKSIPTLHQIRIPSLKSFLKQPGECGVRQTLPSLLTAKDPLTKYHTMIGFKKETIRSQTGEKPARCRQKVEVNLRTENTELYKMWKNNEPTEFHTLFGKLFRNDPQYIFGDVLKRMLEVPDDSGYQTRSTHEATKNYEGQKEKVTRQPKERSFRANGPVQAAVIYTTRELRG